MLPQIIQAIIITVFLLLSGHYLYKNSLRKKQLWVDTLKAAGLALYYLPIFLQGLFLLYAAVVYCFFLTRAFYFLLAKFFGQQNYADHEFSDALVIITSSLLMGVNCWLATHSLGNTSNLKAIALKLLYILFSILTTLLAGYNLSVFFDGGFFPVSNGAAFHTGFPFALFVFGLLFIVVTLFSKWNSKFATYLKIPLFTVILYGCFCFSVALLCFCLFGFFRLLHF